MTEDDRLRAGGHRAAMTEDGRSGAGGHRAAMTEDDRSGAGEHRAAMTEDDRLRVGAHGAAMTEDDRLRVGAHGAAMTEDDRLRVGAHSAAAMKRDRESDAGTVDCDRQAGPRTRDANRLIASGTGHREERPLGAMTDSARRATRVRARLGRGAASAREEDRAGSGHGFRRSRPARDGSAELIRRSALRVARFAFARSACASRWQVRGAMA
jgi:hypothetical protein